MSVSDDQFEIQTLTQRYADAVMRHNADDWAATWAEDGEWYLGPDPIKGRETIKTTWQAAMAGFPFVAFFVQPGIIKVNGDTGTARTYVQENIQDTEGNSFRVVGVYNDEVVREDGAWKFKARRYTVLYRGPVDLSGEINEYPATAA